MRAIIAPSLKSKWIMRDMPMPKPGPNQVLIKICASGLCYTDVHQTEGSYEAQFPQILGHEPAGEIVEIGIGVTHRRIGDRVGVPWLQTTCGRCEWCLRENANFCAQQTCTSLQLAGGHAEYMLASADSTMLIPNGLAFETAAPIFCAGYTVWSGLRSANPKPGERVAVLGIGGLGHLALQYAKAAGFETIAISHSPDKDALIQRLGADAVVRNGEDLLKAGGADIILSTSNSNEAMKESFQGIRPNGRFIAMGIDVKPLQISLEDIIAKQVQIIGSQQNRREHLYEALDMAAKGKVKPIIESYSFEEFDKAYERVKKGEVRFRAVITL